jgi:hypothetical protein
MRRHLKGRPGSAKKTAGTILCPALGDAEASIAFSLPTLVASCNAADVRRCSWRWAWLSGWGWSLP